MSTDPQMVSKALVVYLAKGRAPSPRQDKAAVEKLFGDKAPELVAEVERLLKEANDTPVDWTKHDLVSAGKLVRAKMHERHPNLSSEALDAIEWKFTFDWR